MLEKRKLLNFEPPRVGKEKVEEINLVSLGDEW